MASVAQLQEELVSVYSSQSAEGKSHISGFNEPPSDSSSFASLPVLFLYDCAITISQEVHVIWQRKWTATTWLYALTRYSILVDQIILLSPAWNGAVCKLGTYIDQTLVLVQFLCLAWFSALRVYALLDGKYLFAGIVLSLNLVPFATNMFVIITSSVYEDAEICLVVPGMSDSLLLSLTLATRISVIVGDVLVLAVTWTKTAHVYREARKFGIGAHIATVLFRDGTIYFFILLVVNVLELTANNIAGLLPLDAVEPFFNILPPMIVCHFILSLRQVEPAEGSDYILSSRIHSLRFVGNMAQSLQLSRDYVNDEASEPDLAILPTSAQVTDISSENVTGISEVMDAHLGYGHGPESDEKHGPTHLNLV
ncbi:hypothetical protein BC629DRAFT_1533792 [Irpex lacteus]|nr:hypothetical protein BC629DRAFT_1533792 [Irpex lacteus]